MYRKIWLFIFLLLLSCNSTNNVKDDYEIINIVLQKSIVPYYYYKNDISLIKLKKGTEEYDNKVIDLLENGNYESIYYYTLDEYLFNYKENIFIKSLFSKYDFNGDFESEGLEQKVDFSKVKLKKNLICVKKKSIYINSENYVGDYKISRILYDKNKATVILVEKGEGGREIYFLKKENDKWHVYGSEGIPYKYFNEKIDL